MNPAEQVLNANQTKWQTLPAGPGRKNVQELLALNDADLETTYKTFVPFWERERGWEYERYTPLFTGRHVLEIGSGLGYDGIIFSQHASSWTFCDIIADNLAFVKRVTQLYGRTNVAFQHLVDLASCSLPRSYDGFYAHGVLHHVPFDLAQQEVANLNKYLNPGAHAVLLMYPYERWEMCGKPDFGKFGIMTDGAGTPWAEYYDEEKIQKLFGPSYSLLKATRWGHQNAEFINFELVKKQQRRRT